ncbi:hypothetical protein PS15p_208115 [Mucor circinelloides]
MSTPQPTQNVPDQKLPRWQFRKKKKLEKRRKKRQEYAEKNIPTDIPLAKEAEESSSSIAEKLKYEHDKRNWEEREGRFKLVELAKKKAREKEQRAKVLTQKRWQDTLMTLPMLPPTFSIEANSNLEKITTKQGPFKTFVKPKGDSSMTLKKTYRDRFLERKLSKQ